MPVSPGAGTVLTLPRAPASIPRPGTEKMGTNDCGMNDRLVAMPTVLSQGFPATFYRALWSRRKYATGSRGQLSKENTVGGTRWAVAGLRALVELMASSSFPKQMPLGCLGRLENACWGRLLDEVHCDERPDMVH